MNLGKKVATFGGGATAAASTAAHNDSATAHGRKNLRLNTPAVLTSITAYSEALSSDLTSAWSPSADATLTKIKTTTTIPTWATLIGARWSFFSPNYTPTTYIDDLIPYQHGAGFSILTDAPKIEVGTRCYSPENLHVWVDGIDQTIATDAGVGYTDRYINLTHSGGRKFRRWEFRWWSGAVSLLSVAVDTASEILPAAEKPKIVLIGDSYAAATANISDPHYGYGARLARLMGVDIVSFDDSGTGYSACGGPYESNSARSYLNRLQRYDSGYYPTPALVLCQSSLNDMLENLTTNGVPNATYPGVRANARAVWTFLRTQHPLAPIIVTSPIGSPGNTSVETLTGELRAEFTAWADPLSAWIDCREVFTTANAATYLVGNHPTDSGHMMLARYLAELCATLV